MENFFGKYGVQAGNLVKCLWVTRTQKERERAREIKQGDADYINA